MTINKTYKRLREEWMIASNMSYDDANTITKNLELKNCAKRFQSDIISYTKLIYNRTDEGAITELQPEIEVVTTDKQHRFWSFLRIHTSSIKSSRGMGYCIRLLIRDRVSQKYIGILQLSGDNAGCSPRDTHIGWDNNNRNTHLVNVANIRCCVSMQPVGFNYNVGKLLTAIAFSSEVQDIYKEKYGHVLGAITTFGINGPSVQYSQLPFIKRVGYTKGLGVVKILPLLYNKTLDFMKKNGLDPTLETSRCGKLDIVLAMMRYLELPTNLLDQGQKRSIYLGFTGERSREFLQGKIGTDVFVRKEWPLEDVIQWWKRKWARKRFAHLVATGRLKTEIQLVDYKQIVKPISDSAPVQSKPLDHVILAKNAQYMRDYKITAGAIIPPGFKVSIDLDPSYLAGMIDGDGTIAVSKQGAYLSIGQCDIRVLLAMQDRFGGNIRIVKNSIKTHRDIYTYCITNAEAIPLLKLLSDHIILKQKRCNTTLRWLEGNTMDKEMFTNITALQKDYTPEDDSVWDRVNNAYIAGFFDAEGCISALKKPAGLSYTLTITQTSNNEILQKINRLVGFGKTNDKSIRFNLYNKKAITSFANLVLPYIIVKKEQVDAMMTLMNDESISQKEKDRLVEFIKTCKHTNYTIDKLALTVRNVAGNSIASNQVLEQKEDIYQAKMKVFSKAQSERKRNVKIKDFTVEHKAQIAITNINSKRSVADSTIKQVKELLAKGISQKKICEELHLHRSVTSQVKNGTLKEIGEITIEGLVEKVIKKKETKLARALMTEEDKHNADKIKNGTSKRKFQPNDAIKLLDYVIENKTIIPIIIAEKSIELFGIKLTTNQIKNIVSGNTKLYEVDFPLGDMTYEDYKAKQQTANDSARVWWINGLKFAVAIKVRKLDASSIINTVMLKKENPLLSYKQIGEHMNLTEGQVRNCINGATKVYEQEFPINGISWEEYQNMAIVKQFPEKN